jgi:hypothetical protein
MAEENQSATAAPRPSVKAGDGFSGPIADPGDKPVPDHIHPDTLMAKGIDPDTKEVLAISLAVLQKQQGDEKGLRLYGRIARAGGFSDPAQEPIGSHYFPDLTLEGLSEAARAKVDKILTEKV